MSLICSNCTSPTFSQMRSCTGRFWGGQREGAVGCEVRQLSGWDGRRSHSRQGQGAAGCTLAPTDPSPPSWCWAGSAAISATAGFCLQHSLLPLSLSLLPVHVPPCPQVKEGCPLQLPGQPVQQRRSPCSGEGPTAPAVSAPKVLFPNS